MAKKSFVDLFRDLFRPGPGPSPAADQKMDRRRFFRAGLAEMLKPLDAAIRPLERVVHEVGKLDAIESAPPRRPTTVDRPWLRPPGAVSEFEFRVRCTRCGNCVNSCPVSAIQIDHSGAEGAGYPYIDLDHQPCVLCDGQPCMPACPSGALQVTSLAQIDMGTAQWFAPTCLRTHNEPCTICVDDCPVGAAAIQVSGDVIEVHETGCTGCGVCQSHCPTDPKSIIVIPKSSRGLR